MVKYSQASFHLNALHWCRLSWPLTYCTKNAALIQQQFTENLLRVPLLWQFSSTYTFRRLVPGPVWVVSKISEMFYVLFCSVFIFYFSISLNGKKESLKRVLPAKSFQLQTVGLSLFDSISAPKTWNSKAGFKVQLLQKYASFLKDGCVVHTWLCVFFSFCTNSRKYTVFK